MVRPPADDDASDDSASTRRTVLRTVGVAVASLGATTTGAAALQTNGTDGSGSPAEGANGDAAFDAYLLIDGTDHPRRTSTYQFTVTGDVARDPERSTVGDSATPWDALGDEVDGNTVAGVVGNGVDAYGFSGEIETIEVTGEATHTVVRP